MKQEMIDMYPDWDLQSLPVTERLDELRRNPYLKKAYRRDWECRDYAGWERIARANEGGLS